MDSSDGKSARMNIRGCIGFSGIVLYTAKMIMHQGEYTAVNGKML